MTAIVAGHRKSWVAQASYSERYGSRRRSRASSGGQPPSVGGHTSRPHGDTTVVSLEPAIGNVPEAPAPQFRKEWQSED